MSMRLTINSIDGHNINDANFNAYWPNEDQTIFNLPDVDLQEVSRAGTWPDPSTEVLQGKDFAICIESLGTFASQIDTLKGWFDTKKKGLRKLLMTDENGKQWYVMCKCKSQPIIETSYTEFLMHASDPTLYSEVENSVSETVLATGHQWTLTPVGNDLARLRVTMTPNIAKTAGYGFKAYRPIVNPIDKAFVDHPYDITDGGWDTAALITASKMQASGNDLRPIISGTEVDHWNDGINTTTTKVWINANLAPGVKLTLLSAITNVQAVTELPFKITTLNKAYLKALPASGGKVIRNGEVFTYTAVDLIKCKLTGVTRGVNGTVKSAHAIGDIFNWVQYDCWIMYGNSTMDAPIVDDTKKPLLDLHNSTNTSWVLLNFTDIAGVRTGGFKPKVLKSVGKLSDYYTDTHGADADPAVEMGMVIRAYQTAIGWRGEDADIEWSLYNPAGITAISSNGEKFKTNASWPAAAALRKSLNGTTWINVWNQAAPTTVNAWEAWTQNAVALGASYFYLKFDFQGILTVLVNNVAYFSVFDVTLTLDATRVPVVLIGAEQPNYPLDCTLTNLTTGQVLPIKWTMKLAESLTIDSENQLVTYQDNTNAQGGLGDFSRQEWLQVQGGVVNTIQFDDVGTQSITVVCAWRDCIA